MSYSLNYSVRYFGLYWWFAFVMILLIGILWGTIGGAIGVFIEWDVLPDAVLNGVSVHPAIAFVILFLMCLTVFSTACKWSLEKTVQHNYKSFKLSFSQEKIKFSLALVFQLQVVACSFLLKYTLEVLGIEISEILNVLLDILLLFISNYIIVIRWIARHATITPKDLDLAP